MNRFPTASVLILASLSLTAFFAACAAPEGGAPATETAEAVAVRADRLDAWLLVDELRQTSDDLTRMARLYSVTGEDRYRDRFQRILDIRNGVVARPANPNAAYWDIAIAAGEMPPTDGTTAALRDLLEDAGLSPRQLELVAEAEERSNALAVLESEAFEASLEEARSMLHGDEYNRLKAGIMEPINELLASLLENDRLENDSEE